MQERVSVHPVYHPSGAYRVAVFRRSDGCYRYAVEARCVLSAADKPLWTADLDHSRSGIYDSPEAALQDAERDIVWLTGCPVTTLQSARGEKEERVDQVEVDLTAVMTSQDLHVALAERAWLSRILRTQLARLLGCDYRFGPDAETAPLGRVDLTGVAAAQ